MMPVELGDPLGPGLSVVLGNLAPILEQDLSGVVVRVDLEGDDVERVEGGWKDDWHVVCRHHGGACHVCPCADSQVWHS